MTRLIPIEMIPTSLWSKENSILHLPPQLISSWEMLLDKNNLREQGKIPRMPLHIIIVAGEISTYAQEYAKEALNSLEDRLESQAIKIEFYPMTWDVCCKFSNTDLIKELILRSESCSAKLLLLANFSGFLEKEKKWGKAIGQFDELFRYSRDDNSTALWIEPEKNNVTQENGFFPRMLKWFTEQVKKLVGKDKKINNSDYEYSCSSVNVKHPLMAGTFRTNLAIIPLDLPSRDKL